MFSPRGQGGTKMQPLGPQEAHAFEIDMQEGAGDDLTTLAADEVTPTSISQVLSRRLEMGKMYTSIGAVLVAVNPYKTFTAGDLESIYDARVAHHYFERSALEVAPHVYRIGSEAYKDLQTRGRSQCVIITGESGAGKTETAKVMMKFVGTITEGTATPDPQPESHGVSMNDVKTTLLESNTLFEAFGNAQTIRNDNSSRFGKYLEILFDFKGDVVGGRVTQYLLEKARVTKQNPGERSFHLFYQLLAGASSNDRTDLRLRSLTEGGYNYLMHEERRILGVDDAEGLVRLKRSMGVVGLSEKEIGDVFRLVSAVLLLGNVEFEDHGLDQRATIANQDVLDDVAHLLQVEAKQLEMALTSSVLATGAKSKTMRVRVKDRMGSISNRDSLAKEIYKRLFDFVVDKVNETIAHAGNCKSIGLLDIYGFEVFQENSFEQLCINFVNERLQQHFIQQCIETEQREYEAEGLQGWKHIEFFDNKLVCDAIEKKPNGVFEVLDMQCTFKEATGEQLLASMTKACTSNPYFLSAQGLIKNKLASDGEMFGIKHYAGDVVYTVTSFIEKNRDTLTQDLLTVIECSENDLAARLFLDQRTEQEKAKRPPTISTQFRRQVDELMHSLKACQPHYIRCVKSNDHKQPLTMDMQRVTHQVQYLGLRENIMVRRSGFCYRARFDDFITRYCFACAETWEAVTSRLREEGQPQSPTASTRKKEVRELLSEGHVKVWSRASAALRPFRLQEDVHYVLGRTMVFIKDPKTVHMLEERRQVLLPAIAAKIQACWRACLQRRKYMRALHSATQIEAQGRKVVQMMRFRKMKRATLLLQRVSRMFIAKRRVASIRKQFRNLPPRIWARTIERVYRGYHVRISLDDSTYDKCRAIAMRLEELRRRNKASVRIGAWYRGQYHTHRFKKTRKSVVVVQCLMRRKVAKKLRQREEKEDLKRTEKALREGVEVVKLMGANGSGSHVKKLRLSADGSKLVWQSPFWAAKPGITLREVKAVKGGLPKGKTGKDISAKGLVITDGKRDYGFVASNERQRSSLCRYINSKKLAQ